MSPIHEAQMELSYQLSVLPLLCQLLDICLQASERLQDYHTI